MSQQKDSPATVQDVVLPGAEIAYVTSPKRVRPFLNGQAVADSRRVMLVRGHPPVYYFPREDVRMDMLVPAGHKEGESEQASLWTVKVGEVEAERAAWRYGNRSPDVPELRDSIAFKWDKMDAWFEEDEEVFVGPHDPYSRIDVLHSSRHVRVVVAGETVADTQRPVLLFETGLPARYYIPKADVRLDLLVPSDTHSACPYKGTASYYSVRVGNTEATDVVWYYPFPHPEFAKIQNLLCFYSEKLDGFYVDGKRLVKSEASES